MAALNSFKSKCILLLVKETMVVKKAVAYTWDWHCHLVGDRASMEDRALNNVNNCLNTKITKNY